MVWCISECVKSVVLVNYFEDPGKGSLYEIITYEKVGIFLSAKVTNWQPLSIGVVWYNLHVDLISDAYLRCNGNNLQSKDCYWPHSGWYNYICLLGSLLLFYLNIIKPFERKCCWKWSGCDLNHSSPLFLLW